MPEYLERRWTETNWKMLLLAIKQKRCTPFLGSGACFPTLPQGAMVAKKWACDFGYPFNDDHNLPRVAQYVSENSLGGGAKLLICDWFKDILNNRRSDEFSP